VSAGSAQLSMPMPSVPGGRWRTSLVSGKIREVSNRFVASPEAVRIAAVLGLSSKSKSLPAWLFYDATGSSLFERITELPEYYPTRTERALLAKCSTKYSSWDQQVNRFRYLNSEQVPPVRPEFSFKRLYVASSMCFIGQLKLTYAKLALLRLARTSISAFLG
jgi:hypothetical protein